MSDGITAANRSCRELTEEDFKNARRILSMEVTEWEEAKNGSCCKDYQRIFTILGLFAILASWAFLAIYGLVRIAERFGFL